MVDASAGSPETAMSTPGAGRPQRAPALLWRAGKWEQTADAVSPETRVRLPGGEDELWAWPEDLDTLRLGHALLERKRAATPLIPPPVPPLAPLSDLLPNLPDDGLPASRIAIPAVDAPPAPTPEDLLTLMENFLSLPGRYPRLWEETGCFHRAAAVRDNKLLELAEDIGRHNCIDRLAGWAWRAGVAPENCLLLLSARITGSLYERARLAGFRFLVSRAAVTTAATAGAEKDGVTIIGFCRPRERRFTVFADPAGRMRA